MKERSARSFIASVVAVRVAEHRAALLAAELRVDGVEHRVGGPQRSTHRREVGDALNLPVRLLTAPSRYLPVFTCTPRSPARCAPATSGSASSSTIATSFASSPKPPKAASMKAGSSFPTTVAVLPLGTPRPQRRDQRRETGRPLPASSGSSAAQRVRHRP